MKTQIMPKLKKPLLVLTVSCGIGFSFQSLAALTPMGPAESWTIQEIGNLIQSATSRVIAWQTSYSAALQAHFERVLSALAVAAKQTSVAAHQASTTGRSAQQMQLNGEVVSTISNSMIQAEMDYGAMGQGYKTCEVMSKNSKLSHAFSVENTSSRAKIAMNSLDIAPATLLDPNNALRKRRGVHLDLFCSDAEASAGLCAAVTESLKNADGNAALLFEPIDPLSGDSVEKNKAIARNMLIQHLVGEPDAPLPKSAGKTVAAQQFYAAKLEKDALTSIPLFSLATIDTNNLRSPAFDGKSPNELFNDRVADYFGGDEAKNWNAGLASLNERGLLVEAVKIDGLKTWARLQELQQKQRIMLNYAALNLAYSKAEKIALDELAQQSRSKAVKYAAE